jgi:hypothetical protein
MSAPKPPHADLIERNMAQAFALMHAQIDQPELLADVPADATVILLPGDDPELVTFNLELGMRAIREGRNVYFRHVPHLAPAGGA